MAKSGKENINQTFGTNNLHILASPYLWDARDFLKMTSQEQQKFIEDRFANMDPAELINIVRAIYGHPHDKGRPRGQSASTAATRSLLPWPQQTREAFLIS